MLAKFRRALRYRIDSVFSRGASAQFAFLAILTLGVVLFGMSAQFFGLGTEHGGR